MASGPMSCEIDASPAQSPGFASTSLQYTSGVSMDAMAGPLGSRYNSSSDMSSGPASRQSDRSAVSQMSRSHLSGPSHPSNDGMSGENLRTLTSPDPSYTALGQQPGSGLQSVPPQQNTAAGRARYSQQDGQRVIEIVDKEMAIRSAGACSEDLKRMDSRMSAMSLEDSDSSYGSLSSSDLSSLPNSEWEAELSMYKDKMPVHLKVGYCDVAILYCEADRPGAIKFRDHLNKDIDIGDKGSVKALLYDEAEFEAIATLQIGHLTKVVERSTYIFIYLTKNFIKDTWMEFSSESCLMEAITNPDKQWCVVPVYTERRGTSFKVPMGLNTLKGISYYNNDKFYRNGVARLIGDKVYVRTDAELKQKRERIRWIEKHRREEMKRKADEEQIRFFEEQRTKQLAKEIAEEKRRMEEHMLNHSHSSSELSSEISGYSAPFSPEYSQGLHPSYSTSDMKPNQPFVQQYYHDMRNLQWCSPRPGSQHEQTLSQWPASTEPAHQMNVIPDVNGSGKYSNNSIPARDGLSSNMVGPFQVRSPKYGTHTTNIPEELWVQIMHEPQEQKYKFILNYFEREQEMQIQTTMKQQMMSPTVRPQPSYESLAQQAASSPPWEASQDMHTAGTAQASQLPHLSMLHSQESSRDPSPHYSTGSSSYMTGNSSVEQTLQTGSLVEQGISYGVAQSLHDQNVPNFVNESPPDEDGFPSQSSSMPEQRKAGHRTQDLKHQNSGKKPAKKSSGNVIKNYTVNIYGAENVQVGDNNSTQINKKPETSESSSGSDSGGNSPKKARPPHSSPDGHGKLSKTSRRGESLEAMKGEFDNNSTLPESTVHGSNGSSSVERDAANSAHPGSTMFPTASPETFTATKTIDEESPSNISEPSMEQKSMKIEPKGNDKNPSFASLNKGKSDFKYNNKESFESDFKNDITERSCSEKERVTGRSETVADSMTHESMNLSKRTQDINKPKDSLELNSSVNLNSRSSVLPGKLSEKEKNVRGAACKPCAVARPVAAIRPFHDEGDTSNTDVTELKAVDTSDNTNVKRVHGVTTRESCTDETCVKQVVESVASVRPQVRCQQEAKQGSRPDKLAQGPRETDVDHPDLSATPATETRGQSPRRFTNNLNIEEVEVGQDPLAAPGSSRLDQLSEGFTPTSGQFSPSFSNASPAERLSDSTEFDMVNSDEETERDLEQAVDLSSGSTSSTSSNTRRRGVKGDQCTIS